MDKRKQNQDVLDGLEFGDIVEFPRGRFSHFAVYICGEKVIHLQMKNVPWCNTLLNEHFNSSGCGNPSLSSGSGNPSLSSRSGNPSSSSGSGNPSLSSGCGNPSLSSGCCNPSLSSGSGNPSLSSGSDNSSSFFEDFFDESKMNGIVEIEDFWEVVQDSVAKKSNYLDGVFDTPNHNDIAKRAFSQLGKCYYNILTYNSEHFATLCRYGQTFCKQV